MTATTSTNPTSSDSPPLRLVMMGTGPFAAPTFRALFATRHVVAALVTQPLRAGRSRHTPEIPEIRRIAAQHGVPILDPVSVDTAESQAALARLSPDLFIVADYGQILAPATLAVARLGGINLHGSLLPEYRGAAPINWAIYHGRTETGVTVIHMTPRVDAGPTIAQATTAINPEETAVELETRLAQLGAPLVCAAIDQLAAGTATSLPQDARRATPARRLRKDDGALDWSRSAADVKNQVRAFQPWPKSFTFWHPAGGPPLRLILEAVEVRDEPCDARPGTVLAAEGDHLVVATGKGRLAIRELQPAGKRRMTAAEFLRGHHVSAGDRLGPE